MNKSENKKVKKLLSKQAIFVLLLLVFVVGVGVSYALYNFNVNFIGNNNNTISTCSVKMNVSEDNPIQLLKAFPIADSIALASDPYVFTVTKGSGGCTDISYSLSMVDVCSGKSGEYTSGDVTVNCSSGHVINGEKIKYQVTRYALDSSGNVVTGIENPSFTGKNPTKIAISDNLGEYSKHKYEIRLWIDSTAGNSDMYVSNGSGGYATNSDGSYVTRSYVTKVKLDVVAK